MKQNQLVIGLKKGILLQCNSLTLHMNTSFVKICSLSLFFIFWQMHDHLNFANTILPETRFFFFANKNLNTIKRGPLYLHYDK